MIVEICEILFVSLCVIGFIAALMSACFFYRMASNPKPGVSVLDISGFRPAAIFSDSYLSEKGRVARRLFMRSALLFSLSWIFAVLMGLLLYFNLHAPA